MKLLKFPNISLNTPSQTVAVPDRALLLEAYETMKSNAGAAIAANQLGLSGRFWVMERAGSPVCVLNSRITLLGPFKSIPEGCLSLPMVSSSVNRSENVRIEGTLVFFEPEEPVTTDINEVWTGLDAQIAQHETDHLDGMTFLDRLSSAERSRVKGEIQKIKRINPAVYR